MTLRLKQLAREGQISYRYKLYKNGKFLANAAIASIAVSGGLLAAGQTASAATATTDANATSNVTTATTNATSTGTSDFSSTGSSTTSTSAATTTPDATPDATTGSTTTEADSTESGESTPTATASSVTSSSETPATSSDTDTSSAAISSTSTATDVTGASNATSTSATTGSANTAATASTPATTTKAAATTSVPVTSAATKVAETTASRVGDVNTVAGSNAASPATTDSTADVTAASSVADSISTLTSAVDTSSTGSATTDTVTGSSVTAPASTDGATVGVSAAVEAAKQVSTTDVTKLDNVKYDALTNVAKISGELTDAQLADLKDTMLTQSKLSGIMPTIQMNAAAADVVQPTVVVTPDATTMDNTRDFHTFTVNVTYNDANNVLNGGVLKLTTKNGHFTYGINIGDLSLVSSQTFRGNQEYDYSLKDGLASGTSIPITVEMWVDASMNVGGTLDLTATLTGNDGQINTATTADETLTANPDVALTGDNIGGWIEKNSDIPDGYTETLTIPYDASSSYGVTEPENIDPAIYEGVSSAQKDAVSSSKIVITGDKASIDQWVSHQVSGGVYASSVWTSDGRLISLPETVTRDSDTQVTVDLGGLNPQLAYDLTVSHNEVPAGTPGTSYSYSQSTYVNDVRLKTINWTVNTATNPVVYNEFTPNLWLDNAQGSDVVAGKQVTITFNPSIVSDGTQTNTALDMTLPANFKASSFTVPGSLTLDKIQYSTDDSNWNDVDLQVSSDYNNGDQDYSLQSVPTGTAVKLKLFVNNDDNIISLRSQSNNWNANNFAITGVFSDLAVGTTQNIVLNSVEYDYNGQHYSVTPAQFPVTEIYDKANNDDVFAQLATTQSLNIVASQDAATVFSDNSYFTNNSMIANTGAVTLNLNNGVYAGSDSPYIYLILPKGFSTTDENALVNAFSNNIQNQNEKQIAGQVTAPAYGAHSNDSMGKVDRIQTTLSDGSTLLAFKVDGDVNYSGAFTGLHLSANVTAPTADYGTYTFQVGVGANTTLPENANTTGSDSEYTPSTLTSEIQNILGVTNSKVQVRNVALSIAKTLSSQTTIKSASDTDINADGTKRYTDGLSGVATVQPGGSVTYDVTNTNNGSVPVTNPDIIINLPAVGDKATTSSSAKSSQFDVALDQTTPITVKLNGTTLTPNQYKLSYSTSTDPTRTATDGSTIGAGSWSTDPTNAKVAKVTLVDATYAPGSSLDVSFAANVADSSVPVGEKAYATVTVSGTNTDPTTGEVTPVVLESNKSALTTSDIAISTKNTVVDQGSATWKAADNFVNATAPDGTAVTVDKVTTAGTVDTSKAGVYTVTYTVNQNDALNQAESKSSVATVTVLPIQTINYVAKNGVKDGRTLGTNTLGGIKTFGATSGNQVGTAWSSTAPTVAGYHLEDVTQATVSGKYTADNPTKTVYLMADNTNVTVTYTDDTTKTVLATDKLNGDYGNAVNDDVTGKITNYENSGYKLISSDYPTGTVTFTDKDQAYNVHLVHVTKTVHPDTPGDTDKTDEKALQRDVTEYVNYVDEDGNTVAPQVTDGISFTRIATVDEVTGNVTYTDWTAKDGKDSFSEKESPTITGYTPDQTSIAEVDGLTADSLNTNATVVYAPVATKITVTYDDDTTGDALKTDTLDGHYKDQVVYDEAGTVQDYENAGYVLVSSDYPTEALSFTDKDQAYTIHLAHGTKTVTPDNPGDPDNGDPTGTDYDSLVKVVNEIIHYTYENGHTAHGVATDSVEFARIGTIDEVTKTVTYSDWDALNGKTSFSEKVSPEIDGYTPDQASIAEVDGLTPDSQDVVATVVYKAGTEVLHVDYVNQAGEMIATGDTLTGKTGETYTTHAKSIEGYTLTKTPDNANGYYVATDNPDVVYVYAADQQTATVTYVDQTDNKVLKADTLTGDSGSTSDYRTADTIKGYTDAGYELVSDAYPADGVVFDKDDNAGQSFQVVLKHKIDNITDATKLNKEVTRTIDYVYSDGTTAQPSVAQKVDFTRTGTVDEVTGAETYTDWKTAGDGSFAAVTTPTLDGYTADKVSVDGVEGVKVTDPDSEVKVIYTKNAAPDTGTNTGTPTTGTDTGTPTDTTPTTPTTATPETGTNTPTTTPESPVTTPSVTGNDGSNDNGDGNTGTDTNVGTTGKTVDLTSNGNTDAGSGNTGSTGSTGVTDNKAITTPTATTMSGQDNDGTATGTSAASLPQTGESDSDSLAVLGLALMGLSGLAIGGLKRKKEEL